MEDVQQFQLDRALEVLERTPGALSSLLGGISDDWARRGEDAESWSPFDVVGHMTHLEEGDWMTRLHTILEYGETRAFAPVDRTAMFEKYAGMSLDMLLQRFAAQRRTNLEALRAAQITPEKLAFSGRHPALGTVTLEQLLAAWVVHDLNHLGQIVKTMAKSYTQAVGPWKEYLLILGDS
jgi:uncharacterized damage-inducible protein DinB